MVLPVLIGAVVFIAVGITLAVIYMPEGNAGMYAILAVLGLAMVIIIAASLMAFRMHRWTIEAQGVRVDERPKVPLAGFRRRALVRFEDIAALSRVTSGLDSLIEITTRRGASYRLAPTYTPNPKGIGIPDPAGLENFAAAIQAAAQRAGIPLPPTGEALSMWNKPVGLALQVLMFLIALAFAVGAGLTLLDGGAVTPRPRAGEMYAIALLLPVGAGYLLYRSLQRRKAVLRNLTAQVPR